MTFPPHPPSEFCAPVDAAVYLNVAVATLESWRAESAGPAYYRVGRSIRYTYADLDTWLAAQRVDPSAP